MDVSGTISPAGNSFEMRALRAQLRSCASAYERKNIETQERSYALAHQPLFRRAKKKKNNITQTKKHKTKKRINK